MGSAIDIDLAIRDVGILTMADEEIIKNGEIGIVGDEIKFIGHKVIPSDARIKNEINGSKMVAMPGLINCHTHAAMTLFRGYADDLPLMEWLNEKIWPLEAKLKAEDVYYGTLLACVEMIKSGTTTFADMYFFMDEAAKAVEKSGMRAVLSRGLIGVAPNAKEALEESKEFVQGFKADIILIDFDKPHLYPHHDICAHIVYAVSSADVDTVIIDGKVIMKNRKLLTLDEKLVADKLEYSAKQLVKTSHF